MAAGSNSGEYFCDGSGKGMGKGSWSEPRCEGEKGEFIIYGRQVLSGLQDRKTNRQTKFRKITMVY